MPYFQWLISCLRVLLGAQPLRAVYRYGAFSLLALASVMGSGMAQAATLLTVSSYEVTPYPAARGEAMVFTVTATATDAVSNAVMAVTLPDNVDFSGSTAPADCTWSPASGVRNALECTKASLAKQGKWEVSFGGKAGDNPSVKTSNASVSAQDSDLHQSPKNVEVIKAANLDLKKTGPSTAPAGATVSFTLTVRNDGPDAAESLTLVDTLPTDFVLTSMTGTGWSCASATCTIGSLAANASTAVTVTGRITASNGTVRNSASVSMNSQTVRDPNLLNNSSSADVVISPAVDLRANKTMVSTARGGSTFTKGEQVSMTLSATNTGVVKADGVVVEDTVPAGFANITAANPAATAACTVTGNVIRCNAGSVEGNNAATAQYVFTMNAPAEAVASGSNTATVRNTSPTEGARTPATVNYKVVEDYARLTLSKSKGPGSPMKVGDVMTSTIVVSYDTASTAAATGMVTVLEELSANETYVGVVGSDWSCAGVAVGATGTLTCTHTLASPLNKNNTKAPTLVIQTKVADVPGQDLWDVNNRACMGNTHSPVDSSGTSASCDSPNPAIKGTRKIADLGIAKAVNLAVLAESDNTLTYTLTITNTGPDVAPTVKVTDTLDAFFKSTAAGGTTGVVLGGSGGCTHDGNGGISCSYRDFGVGASNAKEVTITLARPFKSGAISNTAKVRSPDAFDPVESNNAATVTTTVAAKTDVLVQSISGSPGMVPVGVKTTITTEIKNQGPSTAEKTVLYQLLQPAGDKEKMLYVAGSAKIVGGNGSCSYVTFTDGPYIGGKGLKCEIGAGGDFPSNTNYQLVFDVMPTYGSDGTGYPDPLTGVCAPQGPGNVCAAYQTEARIVTTTPESDSSNNQTTGVVKVAAKIVNLAVTIKDPEHDPVGLSEDVVYTVTIENRDVSRATGVQVRVMPPAASAPAGGLMKYLRSDTTGLTCAPDGIGVVCQLHATLAQSILEAGQGRTLKLRFSTESADAANPTAEVVTFSPIAVVWSFETGGEGSITGSLEAAFPGDSVPGNNRESEPTTALPITDLTMLSKAVSKSPVMLNEPFEYTLSLSNKGPSAAKAVVITDTLPSGLQVLLGLYGEKTYALKVQKGGADTTDYACSPTMANGAASISCTVNNVGKDVNVVVKLPVIARDSVYTSANGFGTDRSNTAKVDVPRDSKGVPTSSLDPKPGDNQASVPVQVEKAKITGDVVYAEGNPLTTTSWKAVPNATVKLSGTDQWGNAITRTVTTGDDGKFVFDNLPPSDADGYAVVETQPTGYSDYLEQGPAGVKLPGTSCNGTDNCASTPAANTIGKVVVSDTAKTVDGLRFQELKAAQIKGWVYEDNNNDAKLDTGENKITVASTVVLTGTAYNGLPLSTTNFTGVALSTQSNASGYSFTNLPPSNGTGYTVKQTTEPTGYLNGKTSVQPTADAFNAAGEMAAAAGIYGNTIEKIVLYSAGVGTGNNFGELKPASLSGYAFIDGNKNAFRDVADTSGVTGMLVTLTGTDDQGNAVSKPVNTGTSGLYTFPDLRPGTYAVTITPISGMTHVGAQIGDLGGNAGGGSGPSVGSGVKDATAITNITLIAGDKGLNYNFGQSGEGLSGKVYVDLNDNGLLESGEPGISGVKITLSGTTKDGRDVCEVISPQPCSTTTGADGGYSFVGLPESNGTGYTLTEQAQTEAPLYRYADGKEAVGTLGGTAGNDVISGIKLVGTYGANYNFGEKGIDLPGRVFVDNNGNTTPEAGDPGLAGVTITLSGITVDGQDVCTVLVEQGRSCTVQTGADGKFNFQSLPAGTYTLTETQPKDYVNSSNTPGNAGGFGSNEPNGDTKITNIVLKPTTPKVSEYLFAEKAGGLSGYVYNDKNGSGARDAGDPGIAGVTVKLTGTTEQGESVSRTVTTDANGYYHFDGMLNGTYTVQETQPADWLDGKTSKGQVAGSECAACVNSTSNEIAAIKFVADKLYTEFNFGEVKGTSINGSVYHDANEDGSLNPGEGLGGVTVTLTGTDDQGNPVTKTTTTGPDGKYSFPGLRPSDSNGYTITETQPADIGDFPSNGGQPGTANGKPVGSSTQPNVITGVVLKSGESGEEYNFREKASSLSGTVYRDDNDNGLLDGSERGLANVTVTLTGTSSSGTVINRVVTTDEQGNYSFAGLPSGNYQVVETQPSGMLDGKETAGSKGGVVDNSKFCDAAACNTITNIPLGQAEKATGYLFGERGGSLSGTVYADLNNSGTKDANEQGLAGVQVTLSGTTATGEDICSLRAAAFCTAVTDANGNYKFEGVPPGVYQLVKSQNQVHELFSAQYADGKETAGAVGGKVENRYFGTQPGYNTIASIALTAEAITANAGNIGGYLFGVVPSTASQGLLPPIVSGYVYMDDTHDRVRDPSDTQGQFGWTATLSTSTGQEICVVKTNSQGFYQFDNLNCPQYPQGLPTTDSLPGNPTFTINFTKDGNVLPTLTSSGDNVGTVGGGQITNLVLKNADVLVEQNLPLDPEGVVYDAVTRQPVPGVVIGITFTGSGVFDPAVHLVGGATYQNQTTGADGRYSFILQNDYPSGEYVLTILSAPQTYLPGVSAMIPPCVNTLNVTLLPGGLPALLQAQRGAPGQSQTLHDPLTCMVSTAGLANMPPFTAQQQSTQYYLKFNITRGGSSEILNNHIPVDPVMVGGAILVTKTTPKVNVAKADLVPYTITATNMSSGALANVRVRDMLPPGFRYRKGSATWNGLPVEPEVNGRELTWPKQNFVINEKKTYQLLLMVGAGVGEGEYVNQAWAINSQVNERISNVAQAVVRVVPDPTFDCSDLIGKVFDDKNANGYQDQGEPGIPNVRVVTARGLLVTTDADGRFHVACAAIPQADRGSNFVMKLDERTLPSGYRMTSENPRDVRVTRGKMVKLNFGATVHKVLRLEVDARAFAQDGKQLSAQWDSQMGQLLTQLAQRPTVLRIAYRMAGEGKDVADQRLKALTQRIQDGYAQQAQQRKEKEDDTPPLVIETESFEQNKAEGVR